MRSMMVAAVCLVGALVGCGSDDSGGVEVLDAGATVAGESQQELVEQYATSLLEGPASESFVTDPANCDAGASTAEVYFAPTFAAPGDATVECSMDATQTLMLVPAMFLCIEEDGDIADAACLDAGWDLTSSSVTVDGDEVADLEKRVVDTEALDITLDADNIFGSEAEATRTIARAQPVFVSGLEPGEHVVVVAADFGDGEFAGSLTIKLTVSQPESE